MKRITRRLATIWVLLVSVFISNQSSAASASSTDKSISSRINEVRKGYHKKMRKDAQSDVRYNDDAKAEISKWVNWGNWGNWNNWNNWANWSNWGNWGNWKNY